MNMSRGIRVLHLGGGRDFQGGTASVVRTLVNARNAEVSQWVWVHRDCEEDQAAFIRAGRAPTVNRSVLADIVGAFLDLPEVIHTITRFKIDILHAHTRPGIIIAWLARWFAEVGVLMHLHFLPSRPWIYRFLIRTAGGAAVYNSRRTAEHFGAAIGTAKIVTPTLEWPAAAPSPSTAIRLVAASAFLPHKHLDVFIAACDQLVTAGRDSEVVICGKTVDPNLGSYESAISDMIKERGFIDRKSTRLNSSHIPLSR